MRYPALALTLRNIIIFILLSSFFVFSYAHASFFDLDFLNSDKKSKEAQQRGSFSEDHGDGMHPMQEMARDYRQQGLFLQNAGNLDGAKAQYQKAIVSDPYYAIAYNDLGIISELEGDLKQAEEYYLMASMADPQYLSPYSNLAFVYEAQRDLEKAAIYWQKRVELGAPDDPWTERAKKRLSDVNLALGKKIDVYKERGITDLAIDISERKDMIKHDDKEAAKMYLERARTHFNRGDLATAYREGISAMQLDPHNDEIIEFVEKTQLRMLTK